MKPLLKIAALIAVFPFTLACSPASEPEPEEGATTYLPKTLQRTDTGNTYSLDYDAEGRVIKSTVTKGDYAGQADYWEYSTDKAEKGYIIPPSTKKTAVYLYTLKDGLVVERKTGPEWVISGSSTRNFNHTYDAEKHLTAYETESRKLSGNALEYHYKHDLTWKDGNMVRRITTDKLKNTTLNDVTFVYDQSRLNTYHNGFTPVGVYHTPIEPNFDLQLEGKGTRHVFTGSYKTGGTPPTKPNRTYTFDEKGRVLSITMGSYGTVNLTY